LSALSNANSTNATRIESSVNVVRSFFRFKLLQTKPRNFIPAVAWRAGLVEMDRVRGPRGGVRVVRDHDDRLAVLAVERLEQAENFVAGFAVEIARRLVAKEQRGIADDRPRDADALLFAAGKRARVMRSRCARPTIFSAVATCSLRSRFDKCVSNSGSSTLRSALSVASRL
jgi:hypothetical protein